MKAAHFRRAATGCGWRVAVGLLMWMLFTAPAQAADVVWRDMSQQEQEEWVIRWDIPGSVRHSMDRRSTQGAQARESSSAQQRNRTQGADERRGYLAANERRANQGAGDRRAGSASGRTYQYVEERSYRPLGYYGSVRQDSRR